MTDVEKAFNEGVDTAVLLLRQGADVIPPNFALPAQGLRDMADLIELAKVTPGEGSA